MRRRQLISCVDGATASLPHQFASRRCTVPGNGALALSSDNYTMRMQKADAEHNLIRQLKPAKII